MWLEELEALAAETAETAVKATTIVLNCILEVSGLGGEGKRGEKPRRARMGGFIVARKKLATFNAISCGIARAMCRPRCNAPVGAIVCGRGWGREGGKFAGCCFWRQIVS